MMKSVPKQKILRQNVILHLFDNRVVLCSEEATDVILEDSSMEFDLFEDARRKLAEVFVREGRETLEAERIATYIVQGVRSVPKLLTILSNEINSQTNDEILRALRAVLDNAVALGKAKSILLGHENEIAL